jgi:transglutaminase-like putative cysteine protease
MSTRPATRSPWAVVSPTLALELAVVALLSATAFGFLRLFDTSDVLPTLLLAVVAAEAIAMAGRRLRLPTIVTALVSLTALVVTVANRAAPETTRAWLPTRDTAPALAEIARDGLEAFAELRAPVPALEPFVLAAFVGLWVTTMLTDWGAVRLRLPVESALPASGLFVFASLLGADRYRVASAVVFGLALAAYAVTQRTVGQAERATWLTLERSRGLRHVARNGAALGAVAVLLGLVVGPRLPGATDDELWTWRGQGPGARVVVSPFVTIESRLVEQADTELFRVEATEPAYWRTAGLDVYEGGVWQVRGRFSRQTGRLPGLQASAGTASLVRQRFELSNLSEIWLPAAYAPSRIVDADGAIRWYEETGTLSIDRDRVDNTGLAYTIESVVPRYTVDELRAASPEVSAAVAAEFLALPDDLSPQVRQVAEAVTTGQPTRYDQLRTLQDWFLTEFRYDTQLAPRRGDPVEQFLDERVGFCQQFAGTFALMARALGAPARVAVGFTWGDPDPDDPATFVVTGRHAHAWPEIWFAGLGWVPFEPTPDRGAPGAESWTGRAAAQDSPTDPGGQTVDDTRPETTPGGPTTSIPLDQLLPDDFLDGLAGEQPAPTVSGDGDTGPVVATPLLVGLGLAAGWFAGVPLWDAVASARRRAGARSPAERVDLAWWSAREQLDLLGLHRQPAETRLEFAERAATDRRIVDDAPIRLAELATTARFHRGSIDETAATTAEHHAAAVRAKVRRAVPALRRYRRRIDPRRRLARLSRAS